MAQGPRLDRALNYFDKSERYGNFAKTFMTVVGGMFVFAGAVVASIGSAFTRLITRIVDAFGIGGEAWIFAFTRDPAQFLSESFNTAGWALRNTQFKYLGPFTPWVAVIVAIGVVWMVTEYLDRRDSDVPGLGWDAPVIGNDDDGQPDDA